MRPLFKFLGQTGFVKTLGRSFSGMKIPGVPAVNFSSLAPTKPSTIAFNPLMSGDEKYITNDVVSSRILYLKTPLSDDDMRDLLTEIKENKGAVEELSLHCLSPGAVGILAAFLAEDQSLKKVNLSRCNLGDQGAALIALALTKNNSLRELNLSYCGITQGASKAVTEMIRRNKGLNFLDLSGNPILDTRGALSTALGLLGIGRPKEESKLPMLKPLAGLTTFTHNPFATSGFFSDLAEAIKENTHLASIKMLPPSQKSFEGRYSSALPQKKNIKKLQEALRENANISSMAIGFTGGSDAHWSATGDCVNLCGNANLIDEAIADYSKILLGRVMRKLTEGMPVDPKSISQSSEILRSVEKETKAILLQGLTNEEILDFAERHKSFKPKNFDPLNDGEFHAAIDEAKAAASRSAVGKNFSQLLEKIELELTKEISSGWNYSDYNPAAKRDKRIRLELEPLKFKQKETSDDVIEAEYKEKSEEVRLIEVTRLDARAAQNSNTK